MKSVLFGITATLVAGLLFGCTAHSGRANGTITGQLMEVGGPASNQPSPVIGGVAVRRESMTGNVIAQQRVGADGRFRFVVPAGTYVLTGGSPQINGRGQTDECFSRPVDLKSGDTVSVVVACNIN